MFSLKRLLKPTRLLHLYLGVFTAPALVFFAVTGALQTFSFHETTRGSSYKPPKIIAQISQFHKKQNFDVPAGKLQPPVTGKPANSKPADVASTAPHPDAPALVPDPKPKNLLPMKLFFLAVSIGLLLSTFTGLYMSYRFHRNRFAITAALLAGIIVPIALAVL